MIDSRGRDDLAHGKSAGSDRRRAPTYVESAFKCCFSWPLEVDPVQLEAYKAILAEEQEASVRLEPGVLMLHSVAIAESPTSIRLLEVYGSCPAAALRPSYASSPEAPRPRKWAKPTGYAYRQLNLTSCPSVRTKGVHRRKGYDHRIAGATRSASSRCPEARGPRAPRALA